MTSDNILIYFCKHPEPGMVKSRLAKDLTEENAAKVYKKLLEFVLRNTHQAEIKNYLYCYPNINHPVLEQYSNEFNLELKNQADGDLGAKMYQAIKGHLNENNKVVLIGTDCLELDINYIEQAFKYLDQDNDLVLGPTKDGGYALIGANKINMKIFENISWSSNTVKLETEQKISKLGWKYRLLPRVRDLDTYKEYRYFSTHNKYKHLFN